MSSGKVLKTADILRERIAETDRPRIKAYYFVDDVLTHERCKGVIDVLRYNCVSRDFVCWCAICKEHIYITELMALMLERR